MSCTVQVARFTESKKVPVTLDDKKRTVGDALRAADMQPTAGETIMVNSRKVDQSTPLKEGDVVTLANKPAGGII